MHKKIYKFIVVVITLSLCNLHSMDQEAKLKTYEQLAPDIHKKIFSYLLSNCSDTEAIITAKRLGSTCTTQYNLLLDPIKIDFEKFIFSDINFDQYTINDPLLNLFITILPVNYYLLLLETLNNQATWPIDQLTFIDKYSNLNEKTINQSLDEYKKHIVNQNNTITQLNDEIKKTNVEKTPLMIVAANEKLFALQDNLKEIENKKKLAESDLEKIKQRELYKTNLTQNKLFKKFYTQDSSTSSNANWPPKEFFENWIDAKIDLIYLFCARKLLEQFFYTDEYYQQHAKMLFGFKKNFYTFCSKITAQIYDNDTKKKIESCINKTIFANISHIQNYHFPLKNYTNFPFFNQYHQLTINLPHYAYRLNPQNLWINVHWVNALYTLYKKTSKVNYNKRQFLQSVLQKIQSKTEGTNDIQLMLNRSCKVEYNMHKLMQYINDNNTSGSTITIKTVDGIDHFTQYNHQFLHCIQNNQYPNITFAFQVPKQKEKETKTFFNKKPLLNWYNTLHYLNQDIGKGPKTWSKLFEDENGYLDAFWKFLIKGGLLFFISAMLCVLQEDQWIICASFVRCSLVLQLLGFTGSTAKQGFLKHTFGAIPWYIIHAVLSDLLLLYSIYQYRKINYLVTAYTLFELWMVKKSLFYKPLIVEVYNLYRKKNSISIVPY